MAETGPNASDVGALVQLIDQGRPDEAERRARTWLEIHPGAGMLWKILSVALVRQGKDALPALRRAAELMPRDAEAQANLGATLHDRGLWAEALVSLRRALAIRPHDPQSLVDAANALKALGRAREAVPLYRRALQLSPRLAEAHNNLGNALLASRQYDGAVACYRCALEIKPDDAQILCNLANALRLLGLLDEAAACNLRALARDPGSSTAHNNLGLILTARRQWEEAEASYRRALQLDPGYGDALNNLGNLLRDLGAAREAAALYARALERDPQRAESHCNLGNALLELGKIDEAEPSLRRAVTLQPDRALGHVSLATALRLQGHAAAAEQSCAMALAIDPGCVEALSLLGELRADHGRFAEAEELFRRAIAANPEFPFAFRSIAANRKMTGEDAGWLAGVEALLAKRLPIGHEISLRYALAKYFDDLGLYDDAFDHCRRANELAKRHRPRYDRQAMVRRVDTMIRRFDAPFMHRCRARGCASELPVFVVGMPRSGTSLVEQILASHPAVFGAGELIFWDAASAAYEMPRPDGKALEDLLPDMAGEYLDRLAAFSTQARRVVDKNPANVLCAGLLHAAFPRARIIHMQRHPIDTCLSIYFQHFFNMNPYAHDLSDLAHYYGEYARIAAHWRSMIPAAALLEIPYEALIDDQEGWTRRMLEFVGLPWDPKCLDFHRTRRAVITASKWQVRQKLNAASVGRWRHYEKYLGPLLEIARRPG